MSINLVVFSGRLGADPEAKVVGSTTKTRLRIGSSSKYKNREGELIDDTVWMDADCWGKLAETVKEYCVKGQEVTVIGKIAKDFWENQEGEKRSATYLRADSVQFGSKPKSNYGNSMNSSNIEEYLNQVANLASQPNIQPESAVKAVLENINNTSK